MRWPVCRPMEAARCSCCCTAGGRTSMTCRDCWIIVRPAPITRRCVRRFRTARATRGSLMGLRRRPDRRIARSAITPSRRGHRRMGGRQHRPGAPHRGHGLLPRRSTRRRDAARQPETVRRRSQFLRLPRTWRDAWRRRACATEAANVLRPRLCGRHLPQSPNSTR